MYEIYNVSTGIVVIRFLQRSSAQDWLFLNNQEGCYALRKYKPKNDRED